jgi:hypothetical protein
VVFLRARLVYHHDVTNLPFRKPIPFDLPSTYQICVQGRIDQTWSHNLEGMTLSQSTVEPGPLITTLQGELRDQAALAGVLNTLYELHLTVLSVQRLGD